MCANYGGAVVFGGLQGSMIFGTGGTIAVGFWGVAWGRLLGW